MSETKPEDYSDTAYLQLLADFLVQQKQRIYALMQIQPGHKVIDVGCGPPPIQ